MTTNDDDIFGMHISHVRAILSAACAEVARTGRPLGIRRYSNIDVVIVPVREWKRLKRLEAETQAANEKDPGDGPGSGDAGR